MRHRRQSAVMGSLAWACALVAAIGCAASGSARPALPSAPVAAAQPPPARSAPVRASSAVPPQLISDTLIEETFADPARRQKLASAFAKIDAAVTAARTNYKVPGIAVGIVIDDELAHVAVSGYRDLEAKAPLDADTIFRIGSVTKTFTASAILALRDQGRLRLDDPAARYLPEFAKVRYPTDDAPLITIRQLLTHTSGLPRDGTYDYERTDRDVTEAEVLASLDGASLEFAPGAGHLYSNLGFSLLGLVVARVAGTSYRDYLARKFFVPLGMTSAAWVPQPSSADHLARNYRPEADSRFTLISSYEHLGASEADGGLYLSLKDLARWASFQLSAYPPRRGGDSGPLRRATLREAHTLTRGLRLLVTEPEPEPDASSRFIAKARSSGQGLAWGSSMTCDFDRVVYHDGLVDRHMSDIQFLPDEGVGVVAFANGGRTPLGRLDAELIELLRQTGGLSKRVRTARHAKHLERAIARFLEIYRAWDDEKYRAMLGEKHKTNVPLEREKQEIAGYRALHGNCRSAELARYDSEFRGRFALECDRGHFELELNLERDTGLIAGFTGFSRDVAASRESVSAAERVLALHRHWSDAGFKRLFSPSFLALEKVKPFAATHRRQHGDCKLDAPIERDGNGWQRLALSCARGPKNEIVIHLDDKDSSKIDGLRFESSRQGACAER